MLQTCLIKICWNKNNSFETKIISRCIWTKCCLNVKRTSSWFQSCRIPHKFNFFTWIDFEIDFFDSWTSLVSRIRLKYIMKSSLKSYFCFQHLPFILTSSILREEIRELDNLGKWEIIAAAGSSVRWVRERERKVYFFH